MRGAAIAAATIAVLEAGCQSTVDRSGPESEPALLRTAAAELRQGDLEQAQSDYARARTELPTSAAAWVGFGEASYRLFQACVADPRRGNALFYLQDAESGFRRGVELDPKSAGGYLGLSRVARERGDGAEAAKLAQNAKDRVERGAPAEFRYEVMMGLGHARGLEFEQAARANASPVLQGEVYQRCKDAYLSAKAIYPDKPEPIVEFARVEAKRGAIGDALTFLSQAIAERPEDAAYHQEMFDLVLRGDTANRVHWLSTLVAIYEVQFAKLQETSPTVLWYAGYAKCRQAEAFRQQQDYEAADRAYSTANELFEKSAERNPNFLQSATAARALVLAGEARCLFERRRVSDAAEKLTSAFALDASILEQNDGLGISPKRTSLEIGGEYFKEGELEAGAGWFERWLAFSKDDIDWLNNAGLMRRDLGEEQVRTGNKEKAKACFEASYQYYKRVADLRPDEPRLVNDAALLLLYHLHRDLDLAEEMFRRSIRLGEDKLEELGERPDAADDPSAQGGADRWDYYAEATGDAYQNLALLLWEEQKDSAEIKKLFARSFELDPRGTRSHLKGDAAALPASGPAPKLEKPIR